MLAQVAAAMKAGLAVTVAPHHLLLSAQEAADLLRVSRTTLVRLLETGTIRVREAEPATARSALTTCCNTAGGSAAPPSSLSPA